MLYILCDRFWFLLPNQPSRWNNWWVYKTYKCSSYKNIQQKARRNKNKHARSAVSELKQEIWQSREQVISIKYFTFFFGVIQKNNTFLQDQHIFSILFDTFQYLKNG